MTPDIRTGDTWRSEKSDRIKMVRSVRFEGGRAHTIATSTGRSLLAANFVRGRKLIERGGVRVGDVRKEHVPLVVVKIERDHAGCDNHPADGGGLTWIPLDVVAAMPLLTRDGKAVT